jgi:hypothetical protein
MPLYVAAELALAVVVRGNELMLYR